MIKIELKLLERLHESTRGAAKVYKMNWHCWWKKRFVNLKPWSFNKSRIVHRRGNYLDLTKSNSILILNCIPPFLCREIREALIADVFNYQPPNSQLYTDYHWNPSRARSKNQKKIFNIYHPIDWFWFQPFPSSTVTENPGQPHGSRLDTDMRFIVQSTHYTFTFHNQFIKYSHECHFCHKVALFASCLAKCC